MGRLPNKQLVGVFKTRDELESAVIASRKAGESVVSAASRLGITESQYNNVIRKYTRTGEVQRLKERGAFIVRRLGVAPVFFTKDEVEALLMYLDMLKLPAGVESTVVRLRELAERKETRRRNRMP